MNLVFKEASLTRTIFAWAVSTIRPKYSRWREDWRADLWWLIIQLKTWRILIIIWMSKNSFDSNKSFRRKLSRYSITWMRVLMGGSRNASTFVNSRGAYDRLNSSVTNGKHLSPLRSTVFPLSWKGANSLQNFGTRRYMFRSFRSRIGQMPY